MRLLLAILVTALVANSGRGSQRCPGIDFSTFDTAPVLVELATPNHEGAWETGFSGAVSVEVFVLSTGKVCDARLVEQTGNGFVAAAATAAARQSQYAPALRDGEPVAGIARVTIEFEPPRLRTEPAVLDSSPPMVSEFAEVMGPAGIAMRERVTPGCNVEIPVFAFDGFTFVGDLSIDSYEALREHLAEHLDENHFVGRVHHYLAYAEECRSHEPMYWGLWPDAAVEIWRKNDSLSAKGARAATFYFINVGGEFRVLPIELRESGSR